MANHEHAWFMKYDLPGGHALRKCNTCTAEESRLFDYSSQTWRWFDGNLVVDERPVFILTGNFKEFVLARERLYFREPKITLDKIIYIRSYEDMDGVTNPTIIFYGTWYNNGLLEDDRFTNILNHRR